jgi:hypothetical protein
MATKTLKFRLTTDGSTSIADGADGLALATATDGGEYPITISGITAGWSPDNNSAISANAAGVAAPFDFSSVLVSTGGGDRLIRWDAPAGVYTFKAQVYMPDGVYLSTALRVLDSDVSTVLWSQNGGTIVTRTTDGLGAARQLNTDGSMVTVGTSDAGDTFTTTGGAFYIQLRGAGSFACRLTYFELTDGGGGGGGGGDFVAYYLSQLQHAGII